MEIKNLSYKLITGLTVYRILAAPILILLVFTNNVNIFKWLLALSFFTDFIDGYLARKFKATSTLGSKLDSLGDDLTIIAAIVGVFVYKLEFIISQELIIGILLALFILQHILALSRYKKTTSFHTYSAKIAAILQGTFFILLFFIPEPIFPLFYIAAIMTFLDLIEEIILVLLLPKWEANVKGIYWVLKRRKEGSEK